MGHSEVRKKILNVQLSNGHTPMSSPELMVFLMNRRLDCRAREMCICTPQISNLQYQ
jgi:hypothetical protein